MPGTRGATVPSWRGAFRQVLTERKRTKRLPLPGPKMATRASPPRETHALHPVSAPSALTGLLQVTVGSLKVGGGRAPAAPTVLLPPTSRPKALSARQRRRWKHSARTLRSAPSQPITIPPAARAPRWGLERRAMGAFALLIGGPTPGAGLHNDWAVKLSVLGNQEKKGGTLSHWALSNVNQSDIR